MRMNAPIVLNKEGEVSVVRVGEEQRAIRRGASERHRKKQVVIIHPAVAIVVEVREVLDQFDASLLKDSEIEIRVNALDLSAKAEEMLSVGPGKRVRQLNPVHARLLRHAERCACLNTRKGKLRPGRYGQSSIDEIVDAESQAVDHIRTDDVHPVGQKRLVMIAAGMPLGSRADGPDQSGGS